MGYAAVTVFDVATSLHEWEIFLLCPKRLLLAYSSSACCTLIQLGLNLYHFKLPFVRVNFSSVSFFISDSLLWKKGILV